MPPIPPGPEGPGARGSFGIAGLDAMTAGGPFRGSGTLLLGTPGRGKTLLGRHFLTAGAQAGGPGLYWGFDDPPAWLGAKADALGLDLSGPGAAGRIALHWQAPLESLLDALSAEVLGAVAARGPAGLGSCRAGTLCIAGRTDRRMPRKRPRSAPC